MMNLNIAHKIDYIKRKGDESLEPGRYPAIGLTDNIILGTLALYVILIVTSPILIKINPVGYGILLVSCMLVLSLYTFVKLFSMWFRLFIIYMVNLFKKDVTREINKRQISYSDTNSLIKKDVNKEHRPETYIKIFQNIGEDSDDDDGEGDGENHKPCVNEYLTIVKQRNRPLNGQGQEWTELLDEIYLIEKGIDLLETMEASQI